jgi:hypothetical protein
MARPRKPLKLLEASGATAKNPQRFRERQAQPDCDDPLGSPPPKWTERAKESPTHIALVEAWNEISEALALVGLGNAADRLALATVCRIKVRAEQSGKVSDLNAYLKALGELGLTERGRNAMQQALKGDPLDGDFGDYVRKPRHIA